MNRDREAEIIAQLQSKPILSADAKQLLNLLKLRYERHKEDLVKRESDQVRGRALELCDIMKLVKISLDTNITQG
jgi:hypothetical protein